MQRNRFDLSEWSGAFGDLGTLVPFVVAYISILNMNPSGLLVAFGVALITVGSVYRTPFPVQPMKAIGAAAVGHAGLAAGLSATSVSAAALVTGLIWLLLAFSGVATRIAQLVPKSALLGVVMGLGFTFMSEGAQLLTETPAISAALFVLTLLLLNRPRVPAMLVLMLLGTAIALAQRPELWRDLTDASIEFTMPELAWSRMTLNDLWLGLVLLALPQLPLTFGNAFIAVKDENNRLFPANPVTEKSVAMSTGLMNVFSSLVGGIPMCHGAGGMAGHIQFGARTGGSSIILGTVLLCVGVFFPSALFTLLKLFPTSVLGVVLFFAGLQLALGSRDTSGDKADRYIVLATAGIAMLNVGLSVVFGVAAHYAIKSGWIRI